MNEIEYPVCNITQGSAPLSLQMDQQRARQPPTTMGKGYNSYFRKANFFVVGERKELVSKETFERRAEEEQGRLLPLPPREDDEKRDD